MGSWEITSPQDRRYNCIAWAAGDASRWWEPDPFEIFYWPVGAKRELTIGAYAEAYSSLGYEACDDYSLESGFEKVALYVVDSQPTHAARQLEDGSWTSKLGQSVDIQHQELATLDDIADLNYGAPTICMKRARAT